MLASRAGISQAAKAVRALPKHNIVKLAARMESTVKTATEEVGSFTAADRVTLKNIGEKVGKLENNLEQLTKDVHSFQLKTVEEFSSVRGQISSAREGTASLRTEVTKAIADSNKELVKQIADSNTALLNRIESAERSSRNTTWAAFTLLGTVGGAAFLYTNENINRAHSRIDQYISTDHNQKIENSQVDINNQKKNEEHQSIIDGIRSRLPGWLGGSNK
jgi:Fe2+ transport system protein B